MFDVSTFRTVQGATSTTFHRPPLDQFLTIPELYSYHASNSPQHPLFVYAEDDGTTREIRYPEAHRAIRRAAKLVSDLYRGKENAYLEQLKKEGADVPVVGVLAVADSITFFALLVGVMQLGLIPFPISTRNSPAGVAHLMEKAGIVQLFVSADPATQRLAAHANELLAPKGADAEVLRMPRFDDLFNDSDVFEEAPLFTRGIDDAVLIIHSSGSTAFPKPIRLAQRNFLACGVAYSYGELDVCGEVIAVHALPMFHLMGCIAIPWAVCTGVVIGCFKPSSPPVVATPEVLLDAIKATKSSVVFSVPTFVETWSRSPENIEVLKSLKALTFAGAPLSDPVGDQLFAQGVPLVSIYGSTEVGIFTLMIPEPLAQPTWSYSRVSPHIEVEMVKQEGTDDLFEPVVIASNTYKPNVINTTVRGKPAFATNDLLRAHPTLPGYYKVHGRVDDQIMLSTGEKTNPVPLEALFIKDQHIAFAIIFGRGRLQNGVVIQPTEPFDPSDEARLTEFRNKIWPTVEKVNEFAPSHSRIFKEMIIVTHPNKPFELTAKLTPRRQLCLNAYTDEIEAVYKAVQDSSQVELPVPVSWVKETTEEFVRAVVTRVMKESISDDDDVFQFGCDSLQQTWIRNTIIHALRSSTSLPVHQIPHNMVYLYPTIRALGTFVHGFVASGAQGASGRLADVKAVEMQAMVDKYSAGLARPAGARRSALADAHAQVVVLTGTTGRLGCHMLAQLLQRGDVGRVFALNRDAQGSDVQLLARQRAAFAEWGLDGALLDGPRLALWASDLTQPDLGVGAARYEEIRASASAIVHNAWRVDFNLSLTSFEPLLAGVRNLLDLALKSPLAAGPRVLFVSSIGGVVRPPSTPVPEELWADPHVAVSAGYGESKWVAEQVVARARAAGLHTTSVRVGQLCGDTRVGGWNTKEWVAALVSAAQSLGCMPAKQEPLSWLPVDVAGAALIDMLDATEPVLHLVHPRPVNWDVLFGAAAARLRVPMVPYAQWLAKLDAAAAESKKTTAGSTAQHATAVTLLEFFRTGTVERFQLQTVKSVNSSKTLADFRHLGEDDLLRSLDYWAKAGLLEL